MGAPTHSIPDGEGDFLCRNIVLLEQAVDELKAASGRVENKIDILANTLSSLVRIEERQLAMAARLTDGKATLTDQGRRIDGLEALSNNGRGGLHVLVWVVAAVQAIVGGTFLMVSNHISSIDGALTTLQITDNKHDAMDAALAKAIEDLKKPKL